MEQLKKSGDEIEEVLGRRPEGERIGEETTEASDRFTKFRRELSELVEDLEKYNVVSEEFAQSCDDLEEWLPISKEQLSQLAPISTQPNVIEKQIQEAEVSLTCGHPHHNSYVRYARIAYCSVELT